jgi:Fibronectin type III domain
VTGHRAEGARSSFVLVAVSAMLAGGCMGESDEDGEGAGTETEPVSTAAPGPEVVPPPSDFSAKPGAFSISLSWIGPSGDPAAEGYVLYRNGTEVTGLDGSDTSYVDDGLTPGKDYSYELEAHAGDLTSDRVAVEATTRVPPVRAARVAGVFNIHTKELSASGYAEHPVPNFGWQFRPRCTEGPCDIRWHDLQRKRIRTVLARKRARYSGTYTGPFYVTCAGAETTSVVEIRLKVEAARAIAGEWRATRLTGTLTQSEAPQLGCVSSQARLSLRARLIR